MTSGLCDWIHGVNLPTTERYRLLICVKVYPQSQDSLLHTLDCSRVHAVSSSRGQDHADRGGVFGGPTAIRVDTPSFGAADQGLRKLNP